MPITEPTSLKAAGCCPTLSPCGSCDELDFVYRMPFNESWACLAELTRLRARALSPATRGGRGRQQTGGPATGARSLRASRARLVTSARNVFITPSPADVPAQAERNVMADTEFTELPGPRLTLRRFRAADAPVFAAYRSVPEVARYQSWDTPFPVAAAEEAISGMLASHPDTPGEWFQFAAVLRGPGPDGGELIGDCAACTDAEDPQQAEIGFTIAPAFQGRGYATEAAGLLLGYLFGARRKHRVTANCDARNLASAAVLERLGLRREGHLRESTWAKGEWTDDLWYAMLRREWVAANREGVRDEQPGQ